MQRLFFKVIINAVLFEDAQFRVIHNSKRDFSIKILDRLLETFVIVRTDGNDLKSGFLKFLYLGDEFLNLFGTSKTSSTEVENNDRRLPIKFFSTYKSFVSMIT